MVGGWLVIKDQGRQATSMMVDHWISWVDDPQVDDVEELVGDGSFVMVDGYGQRQWFMMVNGT